MLIDTHCHLDLPPLAEQHELLLDEARAAGITRWIVPAVHPDGWHGIHELCAGHPDLRPAYGIHPFHAAEATAAQLLQLEQLAPYGVAIGEIGLDRTAANLEQQEALFRAQLRLARRHGLPVLIHCRHAIAKLIDILREEHADENGGIMHAFSGSLESARECIRLGFVISLSGTLTWPHAVRPRQLAKELPLQHLVIETDAPDLAPAGHPGMSNRPAWLREVATALATAQGCSLTEVAKMTRATAQRIIPKL